MSIQMYNIVWPIFSIAAWYTVSCVDLVLCGTRLIFSYVENIVHVLTDEIFDTMSDLMSSPVRFIAIITEKHCANLVSRSYLASVKQALH